MYHIVVPAKLRILTPDGIETVWAGRDDRALLRCYSRWAIARRVPVMSIAHISRIEAVAIQRLDVLLSLHLPQVFVTNTPRGIACAGLFGAENGKIDLRRFQYFGNRGCNLLIAPVERSHATDPVEY